MLTDPYDDYARGFVPFLGTTIYLDSRPLIPRVETEFWVERVIEQIRFDMIYHIKPVRVLDLFAGSGAIGVTILKHVPTAHVTFGELEKRHLKTIEKNIRENGIAPERTSIVQTDVWKGVTGVFELIVANPPYVSQNRNTADESTAIEPDGALYAPDDGFYYIEKFLEGLPAHLSPAGIAYVEHEPHHTERIASVADSHRLATRPHLDQYQVERFSTLTFSTD